MTLRDILARITFVLEAMRDGDVALAEHVIGDLAAELWTAIEAEERAA